VKSSHRPIYLAKIPKILTGVFPWVLILLSLILIGCGTPGATPSPTPTPTPTPVVSPTPTPTPTASDNSTPVTPVTVVYPVISNLVISNISASSATIAWSTDVSSTSEVDYLITGSTDKKISTDSKLATQHSITLTGLKSSSSYNIIIKSKSQTGGESLSSKDNAFTTPVLMVTVSPEVGHMAPDFTLSDMSGNKVTLSSYEGKWLIVMFWETTCTHCRATMPNLEAYWETMTGGKVNVLTVNVGNLPAMKDMRDAFLKTWNISFPVLDDADSKISDTYKIDTYPCIFFVDPDGIIRKVNVGEYSKPDDIASVINDLMSK
jgi:peroxiredoxin